MKRHKIKNMSQTGTRVLLFLILAVTFGFANACGSGDGDKNITDAEAVERGKDALAITYSGTDTISSVTGNVTLPTTGDNGVTISWASSDTERISNTGTVTRPDDANAEVTLTATLTKNEATDTREFMLTVIISADGKAVQDAKTNLAITYSGTDTISSVTVNVTLPTTGDNGVTISWASSDTERISNTGTVTRPDDANAEVTLTATLTKNEASDTRDFTLTVVPPCTTSEMIPKLKADPPSLSGCSAVSIRGADMPALRSAGATKEQILAVWSENGDMGFTPAQLKEAGFTIAEMQAASLTLSQIYAGGVSIAELLSADLTIPQMRTGNVPDYALFNEACMPLSSKTCAGDDGPEDCGEKHPTITLTETTLSAMDTSVVLRGEAGGTLAWASTGEPGMSVAFTIFELHTMKMLGDATAELIFLGESTDPIGLISTLSIPLADVFSNPTVTVTGSGPKSTSTQLCPGT